MSGYSHPASSIASTTNGQLGSGITAAAGAGASSSSSAVSAAAPFSSKVSDFVERNRRALIIAAGAGVVVAGGAAGYYYYTRPPPAVKRSDAERERRKKQQQQQDEKDRDLEAAAGGDEEDETTAAADKSVSGNPAASAAAAKKKKKKSRKSTASAGGSTSSATAAGGAGASALGEKSVSSPTVSDGDSESEDPLKLTSAQLAGLPIERRKQIGADLKTKGNKAYSGKKFDEAIEIYSKAIECDEQAVYYSNRAACYTNLNKNEEVVKDCTDALRLDPSYVKALNRRGSAQEALGGEDNLFKALCDFTAGAIIDGFQNESMAKAVDRVMKQLAQEKGAAIMRTREPRLPSPTFIKAYMEAFRNRDRPTKPSSPSQGDETLFLAFDAVDAKNYPHAFSLFNEAIEQGISDDKLKGRALNMRGTFKFIIGDAPGALSDMEESVSLYPEYTQTWVKKASVHMELSDPSAAFAAFEEAAKIDDADPDIYYHRGQVYFITGQFSEAISEYRKSTELDDRFVFSQIQLAVAMYKNEQAEKAIHMFKKIIRDFGEESPEVFNYYGEILLDRGEFTPALENLDKAISLERTKTSPGAPTNVLPMVNKALCLYQSRQALPEAEAICREALQLDPSCDIAVATLGQLLLQQNKVQEAVEAFQQSAEIARTEPELVNALAYENATRAQLDFIEKYPEYAHKLGLAQGRI